MQSVAMMPDLKSGAADVLGETGAVVAGVVTGALPLASLAEEDDPPPELLQALVMSTAVTTNGNAVLRNACRMTQPFKLSGWYKPSQERTEPFVGQIMHIITYFY